MDLESLLHKDPVTVDPRAGQSLIAGPMIADLNFSRSVVMILERTGNSGHFGLVLNRLTDLTLDHCVEDWPGSDRIPVFIGGPVELDRMFILHRLGSIIDNSVEIVPGLYAGGDSDRIRDYIAAGGADEGLIRFFVGYSGWDEAQLTKEIIEHTWAVNIHPDLDDALSGAGQNYWRREVERLGPDYRSWLNIPGHPQLN